MLRYEYSEPYYTFPEGIKPKLPENCLEDTIRWYKFQLMCSQTTCLVSIRNYDNDMIEKDGTIEEYQCMITALKKLSEYINKNSKTLGLLTLLNTKIYVTNNEIMVETYDKNLRRYIEDEACKEGKEFRTLYPQSIETFNP